jgi:hypothetical protein
LNPHFRYASYDDVRATLRKRFTRPAWQRLSELPYLKQESGETVRGWAERLKSTVRALSAPGNQYTQLNPSSKKEAEALVKDETLDTLSEPEMTIRNRAQFEVMDMMVFQQFIRGLREEIKIPVKNALPDNLDAAIAIAERYEDQTLQEGFRQLNLTVAETDPTVKRAEAHLKALNHREYDDDVDQFSGGAPDRENFRCYNCNKKGHYARNCPEKDSRNSRGGRRPNPRFMDRDDSPMRRKVQDMSGKTAQKPRAHDNRGGKSYDHPVTHRYDNQKSTPAPNSQGAKGRGNQFKGRTEKEEAKSAWRPQGPKNGERPPQRGGSQRPPRPLPVRK